MTNTNIIGILEKAGRLEDMFPEIGQEYLKEFRDFNIEKEVAFCRYEGECRLLSACYGREYDSEFGGFNESMAWDGQPAAEVFCKPEPDWNDPAASISNSAAPDSVNPPDLLSYSTAHTKR